MFQCLNSKKQSTSLNIRHLWLFTKQLELPYDHNVE